MLLDNALGYVYKGTAEDFNDRNEYLPDGDLNVANLEQLRWCIQENFNNFLLTGECSDVGKGRTIPIDLFYNGTIKTIQICYTQCNGSEGAYQIEGKIIDYAKSEFGLGLGGVGNKGRSRGRGDVIGVHVFCIIIITNFKELLENGVLAYSSRMSDSQIAEIRMRHKKQGNSHLAKFEDPCAEKHALLEKRRVYNQQRYTIRVLRNANDKPKEGEAYIDENNDFYGEDEYEYANAGMDFARGTAKQRKTAVKKSI